MFINSFISWIGGKKALRKIISRLFPKDYGRYIEVFGGGGWVLFGKKPGQNAMEVYNDFNSNLANLFYCVKTRTWEFLRYLGFLPINSRDEFHVIRKFIEKEEFTQECLAEELELVGDSGQLLHIFRETNPMSVNGNQQLLPSFDAYGIPPYMARIVHAAFKTRKISRKAAGAAFREASTVSSFVRSKSPLFFFIQRWPVFADAKCFTLFSILP